MLTNQVDLYVKNDEWCAWLLLLLILIPKRFNSDSKESKTILGRGVLECKPIMLELSMACKLSGKPPPCLL
jgi:hypothetical protein